MKLDIHAISSHLYSDLGIDDDVRSYLLRRINSEGVKFATCTLPKLGKFILRAIELGSLAKARIEDPSFTYFAWERRSCMLKHFSGLLCSIFDKKGALLENPCCVAIYQIRFVCDYFYKLSVDFTEDDIAAAEEKFVRTDESLTFDVRYIEKIRSHLERNHPELCQTHYYQVLNSHLPRHGPGTFSGSNKLLVHYSVTKDVVPDLSDWAYPRAFKKEQFPYRIKDPKEIERSAAEFNYSEVLFVPKDSRGPRTIVREPFRNLFYQMSYFDYMVDYLESHTYGSVNFRDQQVMKDSARVASITKHNATLDLSEASDRVSYALVCRLFTNIPFARLMLARFSTRLCKLPSGSFRYLKKLSGMGSGFTFPTMAFLIHLVLTYEFMKFRSVNYRTACSKIKVYGDDIIVPSAFYSRAVYALDRVGLKTNTSKCYINSNFRESCGGDYFRGNDVSTVKLRLSSCTIKQHKGTISVRPDDNLIVQMVAHRNTLYDEGFTKLVSYYDNIIRKITRIELPVGNPDSFGGLCLKGPCDIRVDRYGHYPLVTTLVVRPRKKQRLFFNPQFVIAEYIRRYIDITSIDGPSQGIDVERVSISRSYSLSKRKVSAIGLIA